MKELTSEKAFELLMEAKQMTPGQIKHSITVGNAAERIAKKLNLNSKKAKAMGYIHDIGKRYGKPYLRT